MTMLTSCRVVLLPCASALCLAIGCGGGGGGGGGVDAAKAPADAGAVITPDAAMGGGMDSAGAEAPKPADAAGDAMSAFGFKPSNLPADFVPDKTQDVIADGANCIIDADPKSTSLGACFSGRPPKKAIMLSNGVEAVVYSMKSLEVRKNAQVAFLGQAPVILVVSEKVKIEGTIRVGPQATGDTWTGVAGGEPGGMKDMKGRGPGAGGTADVATHAGGGGAAHCGKGAPGLMGGSNGGSMTHGSPELTPLGGGSSGGGANGPGGAGGGALQIIAGELIELKKDAWISAGGGGGGRGAGGGAGGAILLESPKITIEGDLAANGGGGGGNGIAGNPGQTGQPSATAAKGGMDPTPANVGGNGSAGAMLDGSPGAYAANPGLGIPDHGGGGGGGAGRIRINTMTGSATIMGTLSPAMGTACATQGMLK